MTVKELIEQLAVQDQDRLVVMAKDAEGNEHSPLSGWWVGEYKADTTWSGTAGDADEITDGVPALVLATN